VPCLVEKPFAVNAADARELLAFADQRGVQLLTGHHRRHNPIVQHAQRLISDGALGRLVGVSAIWALRKHNSYYEVDWRTRPGAGPILTNLIHDVDSLRYICGEITSIQATTSSAVRGHSVEDTASLTLTFASGALGSILITDAGQSPWAWEVNAAENPDYPVMDQNSYFFAGTEAALGFPRLEIWRHHDSGEPHWHKPMHPERVELASIDPLVAQAEHLARVVRGLEEPLVTGREGARTLACIEAAFESARSGARVQPDFTDL
jgi:predicted dehydrogenase